MADLIIDCLLCYFDVCYMFVFMFGLIETSDKKQSISGHVLQRKLFIFPEINIRDRCGLIPFLLSFNHCHASTSPGK